MRTPSIDSIQRRLLSEGCFPERARARAIQEAAAFAVTKDVGPVATFTAKVRRGEARFLDLVDVIEKEHRVGRDEACSEAERLLRAPRADLKSPISDDLRKVVDLFLKSGMSSDEAWSTASVCLRAPRAA